MAEANPILLIPLEKQENSPESKPDKSENLKSVLEMMIYRSELAHRSSKQTTVFLYGKSGDGKSTTLNYLFNSNIAPTSSERSLREVTEYGCRVKSSHLFKDRVRIGFIDTPGYDDAEGNDPENLSKISHYIDSHPMLMDISHRNYPNIVLIIVSALDNRLYGLNSKFSRMLHVLTKLNVVDVNHPNVVIVVTNAMHFTKDEFSQESKKIEKICKVIAMAHFSLDVPVIFIENLDKRREMETEGDWRILPDGTRQPLNLFNAMMRLMKQSGDEVGFEAIRLFFNESRYYTFEEVSPIPPEFNLSKSELQKRSTFWKNILSETFFRNENEIYLKLSGDSFTFFPLAYHLQKAGLEKVVQIQNKNLAFIKNKVDPYKLTDLDIEQLIKLFNLERINVELNLKLLGLGYSRQLKEKRERILNIGLKGTVINGNYVLVVPEACTVKAIRGVTIDIVYNENFQLIWTKLLKLTFRISYILFQVDINNHEQCSLKEHFIRDLKNSLPKGIDPDNFEYKIENPKFSEFSKKYGMSCTTGLYFGGCFEGELLFDPKKNVEKSRRFLTEKSAELSSLLESYFLHIQNRTFLNSYDLMAQPDIFRLLSDCHLNWRGGNKKYHVNTITTLTPEMWNKWTDSIERNVVCLESMVNSTSLFTLLTNSPEEDIRSYAQEFSKITFGNENNLAAFKFVRSLDIKDRLDQDFLRGFDIARESNTVLTRIEASKQSESLCSIL